MAQHALIIGPDEKALIAALIEKAGKQPMDYETVKKLAEARERMGGENPINDDSTIELPVGYRVTYTHEMQRRDVECRHISVSLLGARAGRGPHPAAVETIMNEFKFKGFIGTCAMWTTLLPSGRLAIEALEPVDGDMSRLMKKPEE